MSDLREVLSVVVADEGDVADLERAQAVGELRRYDELRLTVVVDEPVLRRRLARLLEIEDLETGRWWALGSFRAVGERRPGERSPFLFAVKPLEVVLA